MPFAAVPPTAAWSHLGARTGFEVAYFRRTEHGYHIHGCTTAVDDDRTWFVEYELTLDAHWVTRAAMVRGRSGFGRRTALLEADGEGHWLVNGEKTPRLDGCLDVDLESSALTHAFPVHRLELAVGADSEAPAAYIRAADLSVGRLEQRYTRVEDHHGQQQYDYVSPVFDFRARLVYDRSGLVVSYPEIAVRTA